MATMNHPAVAVDGRQCGWHIATVEFHNHCRAGWWIKVREGPATHAHLISYARWGAIIVDCHDERLIEDGQAAGMDDHFGCSVAYRQSDY